jgi:hypothetical protein
MGDLLTGIAFIIGGMVLAVFSALHLYEDNTKKSVSSGSAEEPNHKAIKIS